MKCNCPQTENRFPNLTQIYETLQDIESVLEHMEKDPTSADFHLSLLAITDYSNCLKATHLGLQRELFGQVIRAGMEAMLKKGCCPESLRLTDDLGNHFDFRIHSDGKVHEGPEICF